MGEIIVCSKYKLGKVDGKFNEEMKKLLRSDAKITKDFFEQTNANTQTSGNMYVEDKEATKQYYIDSKKDYEDRKARKKVGIKAAQDLANALTKIQSETARNINREATVKPDVDKQTDEKPAAKQEEAMPEGDPTLDWSQEHTLKWLEGKKDKDGKPIEFKRTLGIKRLIGEVVNPLLNPPQKEEKADEGSEKDDNSQNTNDKNKE